MNPDSKKCISCMWCISVCPVGAKKLGRVITSLGGVALGALCANRKNVSCSCKSKIEVDK